MKKLLFFAAMLCLFASTAIAQRQGDMTQRKNVNKKDQLEVMIKTLQDANVPLSPSQEESLQSVYAEQKIKMQGLRRNTSDKTELRTQRQQLAKETKSKVADILTDEQTTVLKEHRQENRKQNVAQRQRNVYKRMNKVLNDANLPLSETQDAEIKALAEQQRNELKAIRNNAGGGGVDKEAAKAVREKYRSLISNVLTEDQRQALENAKENSKQQRSSRKRM